ncbi:hypothetical protein [Treponema sp. C6A8]|uniref:hypothetical protein n=1 Tax=Treponema sp. C6A8 TaxID=1410609 RepID=UPI00048078E8|nr:hypothetical protein [Treponema sp. C6A8]
MKRSFFAFFLILGAFLFAQESFRPEEFQAQSEVTQIPDELYGIWEGKDRIVFFEEAGDAGNLQAVIFLKEYYGWYYDRAVEPEEYEEKAPRTRNSGTTKDAQQIYIDIKNLKKEEGRFVSFEMETALSRRQKNLVPLLIADDKIFLDFYLQDENDKNMFIGHSLSRGITMNEQPLSENIGVFYLTAEGNSYFDIRYWKSDMDFESEKVNFTLGDVSFMVPKHVISQNQNYSCVSGRSKKIRNPQGAISFEKRGVKYMGGNAAESPFLILDKEPYLVRIADKKTFDDLMKIVKDANSRRKPDPPALFPPHEPPLDWHWDLIDALEKNNPYIQAVRERQKAFGPRAKDLEIHK